MFELIFIVGIMTVATAITVWLLRRGTKEENGCAGCACGNDELANKVRKLKAAQGKNDKS